MDDKSCNLEINHITIYDVTISSVSFTKLLNLKKESKNSAWLSNIELSDAKEDEPNDDIRKNINPPVNIKKMIIYFDETGRGLSYLLNIYEILYPQQS